MAKNSPAFDLEHLHRNADQIRDLVGLVTDEPVDVQAIVKHFGARVKREEIEGFDASEFSGIIRMIRGVPVIIVNKNQSQERENVTILEEVCHLYYKHPLETLGQGGRNHRSEIEQEAYQTAAAVLLPAVVVAKAVYKQTPVEEITRKYGASKELFNMRVKVMGLWDLFTQKEAA